MPNDDIKALVLAPPELLPAKPSDQIDVWNFPNSAEDVLALAMQRYGQRRAKEQEKQQEAASETKVLSKREKAINKADENPETFNEWIVHVIRNNFQDMEQEFRQRHDVTTWEILRRAYPEAARGMTFEMPDALFQKKTESGEWGPVENFIINQLGAFLLKVEEETYKVPFYDLPSRLETLNDSQVRPKIGTVGGILDQIIGHSKDKSPTGTVTLEALVSWLIRGYDSYLYDVVCCGHLAALGAASPFVLQRAHGLWAPIALCEFPKNLAWGKGYDAMNYVLNLLLPPPAGSEVTLKKTAFLDEFIPDLNEFPNLRNQVTIHLQRLAIKGEVSALLEEHLYGKSGPVSKLKKEYDGSRRYFGENSKSGIRARLADASNTDAESQMRSFICIMNMCTAMCDRARLLRGSTDETNEAELLLEVARIYADFLKQMAVELEFKLRTPGADVALPGTEEILNGMLEFGAGGQNMKKVAREAMERIKRAEKAATETRDAEGK